MRKVVAVAVALVVSATVAGAQGTSTYNKSAAKPTTQASKSTQPGKTGVEEVNINATDGSVVGKVHESAKTESKEAAQEAKGKKTAPKK